MSARHPSEYASQPLCPCCGRDEQGDTFGSCVSGYTHEESCARHVYADDLCAECDVPPAPSMTEPEQTGENGNG